MVSGPPNHTVDIRDLRVNYGKKTALEPRVFEASVLVIECTFLGPETRNHGKRYGHLHLRDLVDNESRFENDAVVLTHLSRRFKLGELESAVVSELPGLAGRVHFLTEAGEVR